MPPYISFTIGALSRLFNTIPISFRFPLFGSNSYNIPTYRFFDNKQNGIKVFSYSKSCGPFKNADANSPASCANSIVISNAFLPLISLPSVVCKLKVKNTESVL